MRTVFCSICLLLMVSVVFAQSDRGTVTGTVTDPSGATIPGAAIAATNSDTGTEYKAASTATGNFTLAQLPAGTYELSVTVPGFKKYVRPGIVVSVAQTVRTDVKLEVGQITETVTVEESTPLLKTETGELSHVISTDRADSLPLLTIGGSAGFGNIRNPLQVTVLLPGAQFANENTLRINGMPSSSHTIRIEGQDATSGMWRELNQTNQTGLDAVQEVSIQTSNFAAEYGQAGGGYFNYTMKSGSNRIHGSAYDYNVNEAYNAGTPNTNDGTGNHVKNALRRNDWGFTFGGPVYIPKLYDGRDKTFFFFTFEQFRQGTSSIDGASFATVPTAAYRAGDFSQALGPALTIGVKTATDPLGRTLYQNEIFNPFKTYTAPNGAIVRDPFMGCDGNTMNVICTNPSSPNYVPFDPVALKMQTQLPDPRGVNAANLTNNYANVAYSTYRHNSIPTVKIDHNLTSNIKLSGFFSENITHSPNNTGYESFEWTGVSPTNNHSYTSRVNVDATLRPTLLFHVGVGYMYTSTPAQPQLYDQSKLGFTNDFIAPIYPYTTVGTGAGNKGGLSFSLGPYYPAVKQEDIKPTANTNLTWVKGNHTIKAGGELMLEGLPITNYSRAGGILNFGAQQTAIPWEDSQGLNSSTGFNYASFLLGQTSSMNYAQITNTRLGNHALGLYVQDTWKVTRRLTLDYGLRYDLQTLLREQYGRMQSANFSEINSLIVPAGSSQGLAGTVDYEATCNCRFGQTYKFAFGPRLGVAYQITSKTVFRAGAGIMYGTSPNNAMLTLSVSDFYQLFPASYGMAATTLQSGNPDPNLVWPDFSPHYPAETIPGVRPPAAPFISIADNTGRPPRIFQWSIGLQRELGHNIVVEASYVGNRGAWWTAPILSGLNYNALTIDGLKAERMYGDTTGIDFANDSSIRSLLTVPIATPKAGVMVVNPAIAAKFPALANITNATSPSKATIDAVYKGFPAGQPLGQALRAYPQWLGVPPFLGPPLGDTWYDSLQAKLTKRFSHGLDMQAAFTWQKELTLGVNSDTSYFTPGAVRINDVFDRMSNKQISALSKPFMLVISFNYITPKLNASGSGFRALSWLTRDWAFGGVLRYMSGDLIPVPTSINGLFSQLRRTDNPATWGGSGTYWNRVEGQPLFLVDPNSNDWDPTKQLVLNPAAWTDTPAGQFSKGAPYYNDYRWRRTASESLSLGRRFPIGSKEYPATFELRIELQNVFNRNNRGAPSSLYNPASITTYNNPIAPGSTTLGALSGGYGFVNTFNGAGAVPRSGQIVARINF
jgi:hypothetical protein